MKIKILAPLFMVFILSNFFVCNSWGMENEDQHFSNNTTTHPVHQKIKNSELPEENLKQKNSFFQRDTMPHNKENAKCSNIISGIKYATILSTACFTFYKIYELYDLAYKIRGMGMF